MPEHRHLALIEMISGSEKQVQTDEHIKDVSGSDDSLTYTDIDKEPEFHARTWIALGSMFLLNLVQVFALQGPPAVVSISLPPQTVVPPDQEKVDRPSSSHTSAMVSTPQRPRPGCPTPYPSSKPSWARSSPPPLTSSKRERSSSSPPVPSHSSERPSRPARRTSTV